MNTKRVAFYIGALLVLFGFWISTGRFTFFFGIPLYVVGALLILFSSRTAVVKTLWIVTPIALWYPVFKISPSVYRFFGPTHVYLIPEKFRGRIVVFYNEGCGQELVRSDEGYEFQIPNDGILILKDPMNRVYKTEKFFLINGAGAKKELSQFHFSNFDGVQSKGVANYEDRRDELACFDGAIVRKSDPKSIYEFKFISSYDSIAKYYSSQYEQTLDSLMVEKLVNCRK